MLTIQEIKKNAAFFIIMTLVLSLLLSAGASLFNFSFEINREVLNSFERDFEFGYEVRVDGFIENTDEMRANGVFYARYQARTKIIQNEQEFFAINLDAFQFENHLPIAMQRAYDEFDDFIVGGQLWNEGSNGVFDGRFPIFLSDFYIHHAKEAGIIIGVGDEFNLYERIFISFDEYFITYQTFFVKGIFRVMDIPFPWHFPWAAISIAAEQAFRNAAGELINTTYLSISNIEDLMRFRRHANRVGLNFSSWIADEIALVGTFSGIFISVSLVILLLSGFVVFIYSGMIINNRMGFIGILKAMGMSNFRVSKMFFFMILTTFIIAFIIGNIFSIFINSHFVYLAYSLFSQNLNLGFNIASQIILLGVIVFIVFMASVLLYKKIKSISIAKVLISKD